MRQVNCYIPIKLCITGRLSDAQLDELGDALVRAVAGRISFAERTIGAQSGRFLCSGSELVHEHYDPAQESALPREEPDPSYQAGKA